MWHQLLTPFLLLLHLFQSPLTVYTHMVDRVSLSIVRITGDLEIDTPHGAQHISIVCTGEVVAPDRVLTAAHCLSNNLRVDGQIASVLRISIATDLALLQTSSKKPPLALRDDSVQRFEPLTGIGYAYGWTVLTALHVTPTLIDYTPDPETAPGIFVQGAYIGGMSGGPVVDEQGYVVGVMQRYYDPGAGYGVGTVLIRALLVGAL